MRVAFWGSPEFAVATLEALLESRHEVVTVVTRPAKPRGRGRRTRATPVARRAETAGVPVLAPARPRGGEFLERLAAAAPDVSVVAAYGAILPPEALDLPPHGSINVHASLLPAWRGAAPVTRAILAGDRRTGVTIMRMDAGLDTGPILLADAEPIRPDDTAGSLTDRLARRGAALVVEALDRLERGALPATPQDETGASHAPRVTPAEAEIDWGRSTAELERAVRAFDPWPGAWTACRRERIKVFRLAPQEPAAGAGNDAASGANAVGGDGAEGEDGAVPGTVLATDPEPLVRTGDGAVRLALVQPAGGRRMAGAAWARGRGIASGDRLGAPPPGTGADG
ncbi:MAG TPA: methionyl-tRNA formyltransferase [Gemmatimonadota bacterium]|nr:methionyl-tRNA formyltransferase [Gemmatimonadota bacterium]